MKIAKFVEEHFLIFLILLFVNNINVRNVKELYAVHVFSNISAVEDYAHGV
jgi:hypothetical protein